MDDLNTRALEWAYQSRITALFDLYAADPNPMAFERFSRGFANAQKALKDVSALKLHNPKLHKLGKRPARHDARNLKLVRYMDPAVLPTIPPAADWGKKAGPDWGMMLNDRYGDCTCAGAGHAVEAWTSNNPSFKSPVVLPDGVILGLYRTVTGQEGAQFDPGTDANDNGCYINDVLNEWRKNGLGGHGLGAYAEVDEKNQNHVMAAVAFYGLLDIGIAMPVSCQDQPIWDVVDPNLQGDSAPGSWGGHCVIITGYNDKGLTCITWGAAKFMTWAFWNAYCDEAFVLLSPDWVTGNVQAPSGFDLATLQADLALVNKNNK